MRILLIEDDENIAKLIEVALFKKGYKIIVAKTGLEGLRKLKTNKVDLILLDRGLPDLDGLNICKDICRNKKEYGNIPIIIISGMTEKDMEEKCLKSGAIDFIEKPFNIKRLELKISSIRDFIKYGNVKKGDKLIEYKNIRVDKSKYLVYEEEKEVILSPKEYNLLIFILENRGEILKKKVLIKEIWKEDYTDLNDVTLYTHISRLKKKIRGIRENLKTIYKKGYTLKER